MQKILLGFLAITLLIQCQRSDIKPEKKQLAEANISKSAIEPISAAYDAFGVDINEFDVKNFSVQKNESLYLLLEKMNLSQSQIYSAIH